MIFEEKTIESKKVFEGKIINLKVETVEFPDGTTAYRELVEHPGGVGVIAITDEGKIPLVKQYRKPFEKVMYEIPAGKLDKKEEQPLACGIRELQEETGYTAKKFVDLGYIYPSPGFVDEITYIYFAKGLEKGKDNPDEDEFLDVEEFSLDEVRRMIMNNEINDAKSVTAFLKCEAMNLFEEEKRNGKE